MNFYLIVGIAALGELLFGYDTGVISGLKSRHVVEFIVGVIGVVGLLLAAHTG